MHRARWRPLKWRDRCRRLQCCHMLPYCHTLQCCRMLQYCHILQGYRMLQYCHMLQGMLQGYHMLLLLSCEFRGRAAATMALQ